MAARCMICAKESILPLLNGTCRGCHRLIQARESDAYEMRQIKDVMPTFSFFEKGIEPYRTKFRRRNPRDREAEE